jgi:hypothetical protein
MSTLDQVALNGLDTGPCCPFSTDAFCSFRLGDSIIERTLEI